MLIVGIPLTLMLRGPLMLMLQGRQGLNQRATSWSWLLKHHVRSSFSCSGISSILMKMQMQTTHCHHLEVLALTFGEYKAPEIPSYCIVVEWFRSCGCPLSWLVVLLSCLATCESPHTVCEPPSNLLLELRFW